MKTSLVHLTAGAGIASLFFASPAYSQPICYMVNNSNRAIDLSSMCGNPRLVKAAFTRTGDFIKVATLKDGNQVFLDYKDTTAKNMVLRMLDKNDQGLYSYNYSYSCAERRTILTKMEVYRNGRYVEMEDKKEAKFESGSAIDEALTLTCRKVGSPGY